MRLHRIDFIFQFFNLTLSLIVLENIELPLALADVRKHERRKAGILAPKVLRLNRPSPKASGDFKWWREAAHSLSDLINTINRLLLLSLLY